MIQSPVIDSRDLRDRPGTPEVPPTKGINDFIAAEMQEMSPEREAITVRDTEPYGMRWFRRSPGAAPELIAQVWFYHQVARGAEDVLMHAIAVHGKDEELQSLIKDMAAGLREYICARTAINTMSGKRKFANEMNDAAYQLCQSAKYIIDCEQRTSERIARGQPIDDEQIAKLRERAEESMREGYAIAQAVTRASDEPVAFDFNIAARRVVDYSCKSLTTWYAQRRANQDNENRLTNTGAAFDLSKFFSHLRK